MKFGFGNGEFNLLHASITRGNKAYLWPALTDALGQCVSMNMHVMRKYIHIPTYMRIYYLFIYTYIRRHKIHMYMYVYQM